MRWATARPSTCTAPSGHVIAAADLCRRRLLVRAPVVRWRRQLDLRQPGDRGCAGAERHPARLWPRQRAAAVHRIPVAGAGAVHAAGAGRRGAGHRGGHRWRCMMPPPISGSDVHVSGTSAAPCAVSQPRMRPRCGPLATTANGPSIPRATPDGFMDGLAAVAEALGIAFRPGVGNVAIGIRWEG